MKVTRMYELQMDKKSTFDLWTASIIGQDPFAKLDRMPLTPAAIVYMLGEHGA